MAQQKLKGQVCLVTGASRGIGRGIALQLGEAGGKVYITGRAPKESDSKDGSFTTLQKVVEESYSAQFTDYELIKGRAMMIFGKEDRLEINTFFATMKACLKKINERGGQGVAIYCDHSKEAEIKDLFDQIDRENNGRLDILINNAYAAIGALAENWGKKYWEQDPLVWDTVNNVGLRNHYSLAVYIYRGADKCAPISKDNSFLLALHKFYSARLPFFRVSCSIVNCHSTTAAGIIGRLTIRPDLSRTVCSVYAARLMVPRRSGFIVTVSSLGGLKYMFSVPYGVGKAACDRMAQDTAHELKKYNVTAVSLWPGAVNTEKFGSLVNTMGGDNEPDDMEITAANLQVACQIGETTQYAGKAIVHLAADPKRLEKTGRTLLTADLGDEYGFTDVNGRKPPNNRSIQMALAWGGYTGLAAWIPDWLKFPLASFTFAGNKF